MASVGRVLWGRLSPRYGTVNHDRSVCWLPLNHSAEYLATRVVSAPFRGTQLVYLMGEETQKAPAVRTLSFGSALSKVVHVISYFRPFLPTVFDLHADSRSLSCSESTFSSFLRQLWHSDWAEGRDATPFDVTFQAAEEREAKLEGAVNPRTYYQSYAATMVSRSLEHTSLDVPVNFLHYFMCNGHLLLFQD